MNFIKPALSVQDQIALLKSRGLRIIDEPKAAVYLSNISYYRLSAYLLSFQRYGDSNHSYMEWAVFENVIRAYVFDRELRLICLDAIERIEVAVRCRISQEYTIRHGNNWYEDPNLFTNPLKYPQTKQQINKEISLSKEVFVQHYKMKYTHPINPPSWMTIEILSFGTLSKMYKDLKSNDAKKAVADYFGVSQTILANWLENLSYVRNTCAHHSRLWNRTMTKKVKIPTYTAFTWIGIPSPKPDKLYHSLCVMAYLLERINRHSPFKGKLRSLTCKFYEINLSAAGFPKNWKDDEFWKSIFIPITHKIRIVFFTIKKVFIKNT